MLQQGELGVVRCEKESARGVHLDSKVGRVKRMHLCIEGSIKISHREIEMFHLPGHSIAIIATLNVSKVANGTTTGSKQISVLGFAVEVIDKQGDDSPFLVIEYSKKRCGYLLVPLLILRLNQQSCSQRGESHICRRSV